MGGVRDVVAGRLRPHSRGGRRLLCSSNDVTVADGPTALEFLPAGANRKPALVFICGSGFMLTLTRRCCVSSPTHSQFGHYGRQLFDGTATISREQQQAVTRQVLLEVLRKGSG